MVYCGKCGKPMDENQQSCIVCNSPNPLYVHERNQPVVIKARRDYSGVVVGGLAFFLFAFFATLLVLFFFAGEKVYRHSFYQKADGLYAVENGKEKPTRVIEGLVQPYYVSQKNDFYILKNGSLYYYMNSEYQSTLIDNDISFFYIAEKNDGVFLYTKEGVNGSAFYMFDSDKERHKISDSRVEFFECDLNGDNVIFISSNRELAAWSADTGAGAIAYNVETATISDDGNSIYYIDSDNQLYKYANRRETQIDTNVSSILSVSQDGVMYLVEEDGKRSVLFFDEDKYMVEERLKEIRFLDTRGFDCYYTSENDESYLVYRDGIVRRISDSEVVSLFAHGETVYYTVKRDNGGFTSYSGVAAEHGIENTEEISRLAISKASCFEDLTVISFDNQSQEEIALYRKQEGIKTITGAGALLARAGKQKPRGLYYIAVDGRNPLDNEHSSMSLYFYDMDKGTGERMLGDFVISQYLEAINNNPMEADGELFYALSDVNEKNEGVLSGFDGKRWSDLDTRVTRVFGHDGDGYYYNGDNGTLTETTERIDGRGRLATDTGERIKPLGNRPLYELVEVKPSSLNIISRFFSGYNAMVGIAMVVLSVLILVLTVALIIALVKRGARSKKKPTADKKRVKIPQQKMEDNKSLETDFSEFDRTMKASELEQENISLRVSMVESRDGYSGEHVAQVCEVFKIGRKRGVNDLVFTDTTVSSEHCELVHKDGVLYINDLKSYNGVRVNGELIQSITEITEDDSIQLGHTNLRITRIE